MKTNFNEDKIKKIKKIKKTIVTLSILSIIFLYINHKFNFYIPCIFHKITGLYCPGCGLTRMILSIIKLNFYQAFRYNPLLFILLPIIIIYETIYYYNWIQNKNLRISKKIWYIILIITIIYMILRNIPFFSFLKPTTIK